MSHSADSSHIKQANPLSPPPSFKTDTLLQIRTGKTKPLHNLPIQSAIYKTPQTGPISVSELGLHGDEQAFHLHGGPDKALLHYYSLHYSTWQTELPLSAHRFEVGGFGENLVSDVANEGNICIGDIIDIGETLQVQVSLPRQPCFKLNHRFEVADMARRAQEKSRTGWYYRVLRPGTIKAGDEIRLVARLHPQWTVEAVQRYLHRETNNVEAMQELVDVAELGDEVKTIFRNRLMKKFENQEARLVWKEGVKKGDADADGWREYRVVGKREETMGICSLVLERVEEVGEEGVVGPGSHVRLKLGKLVRAYSVVGGTGRRFELGVALSAGSRGGSKYLHEIAKAGDVISASKIVASFPLSLEADHHILIAGGIGITAFLAAAKKMQASGESYVLHLAVRSSKDIPFQRYLEGLKPNVVIHDKSQGQALDLDQIILKANDSTHIYCCGSTRLMNGVAEAAKKGGVPDANVHFETFEVTTGGDPFTASLTSSDKKIEVDGCKTLLEALREAGMDVPSSCEVGNCGSCRVNVREGRVEHRGTGLLESEKRSAMLSCVSRGIGHIVIEG
ncbi:MAG: hypothetical protein M1820_003851 [Bogoriella megaspora]|nr:MAG: hypothetical protein M1820_003851 [Bogoriella megaspora]